MLWRKGFFLLVLLIHGCGFEPLYGPSNEVSSDLETIKIAIINDRSGQILRNNLLKLLTPQGSPAHPKYSLEIKLTEAKSDLSFRKDATSRRTQITISAHYSLKSFQDNKVITSGVVEETSGFSIGSKADFSSLPAIISEKDARERLIDYIAQALKLEISSFLRTKGPLTDEG